MNTTDPTPLLENDVLFTVPNVLSPEECADFIRGMEARGFADAPITTHRGFVMRPEVRNNSRVILDDNALASRLWERLAHCMPDRWGPWHAVGLNERFRFYRYDVGQYFRWHGDGAFVRSSRERSLFTAMVYLNDDFRGGTTDFKGRGSVTPRRGMALFFEHSLLHQGAPVTEGQKYVLRTDVMYRYQSTMLNADVHP